MVWAKWFQDCIALWKRLEETGDYLLPQPSKRALENYEAARTPSGFPAENGASKNNEDIVMDTGTPRDADTPQDTGTPAEVELDQIDWAAAHDEIEAFLNESGDDDDDDDDDNESEVGAAKPGLGTLEIGEDFQEGGMQRLFEEDAEEEENRYGSE